MERFWKAWRAAQATPISFRIMQRSNIHGFGAPPEEDPRPVKPCATSSKALVWKEVPLLDGSSMQWVEAIEEAGICLANDESGNQMEKMARVLCEPVQVFQGDSFVAAFRAPAIRITYGIDFPQAPAIGCQWFSWCPVDTLMYKQQVAPSRTFCIYEQIQRLQTAGLIKGGSMDNALVCSMSKGWLNPPLHFPEEPCRHKLLDLIGDLSLCAQNGHQGLPIAHIIAFKASHALHIKFADALSGASC